MGLARSAHSNQKQTQQVHTLCESETCSLSLSPVENECCIEVLAVGKVSVELGAHFVCFVFSKALVALAIQAPMRCRAPGGEVAGCGTWREEGKSGRERKGIQEYPTHKGRQGNKDRRRERRQKDTTRKGSERE